MVNFFTTDITNIEIPESFPSPFLSEPHPLCIVAADELKVMISNRAEWIEEIEGGKMFGVLVVGVDGKIGYLAAFSGNIAGSNYYPGFVPPVYDLLNPDGFFKIEEQEITDINRIVSAIESGRELAEAVSEYERTKDEAAAIILESKEALLMRKKERDSIRNAGCCAGVEAQLIKESQFDKAEHKRLERRLHAEVEEKKVVVDNFLNRISELKELRKKLSAALQMRIFGRFNMLNVNEEAVGLPAIFASTPQRVPPAGAGECAGPKLLQYAFANQMKPICMAEFWWGNSPKTEIRHHGHFYPACKGKCEPIMAHMLKGMDVEEFHRNHHKLKGESLEIVFEDEWIVVVDKPAGVLSVPGREASDSVLHRLQQLYPDATGPLLVHRLDMETSGLLVAAKTAEVHRHLQSQFAERTVNKRYIALLDGVVEQEGGVVQLPLSPDYMHRPMQMVDDENGKDAVTLWEVHERRESTTLVAFTPVTGRTHQLRVHAAHYQGVGFPILGDELYGRKSDRLYLHAEKIDFFHPVLRKRVEVERKADFV